MASPASEVNGFLARRRKCSRASVELPLNVAKRRLDAAVSLSGGALVVDVEPIADREEAVPVVASLGVPAVVHEP
jgi:hypothetical protein